MPADPLLRKYLGDAIYLNIVEPRMEHPTLDSDDHLLNQYPSGNKLQSLQECQKRCSDVGLQWIGLDSDIHQPPQRTNQN